MFDIGFLEMTTIGIVALVVIGPERLPEVAAKVGRYVGKAQRFVRGVRSDISRELETGDLKDLLSDQKNQIDELRKMVNTATKDIESSTSSAFKDAKDTMGDIKNDIADTSASDSSSALNDPGAVNDIESEPEQLNKPDNSSQSIAENNSDSQSNKAS